QAEDGIRDLTVTGVQTCALPISHPRTIAHTVRGFDDMARLGAQVTIFRLGSDPGLARFIDQVARRVEGRVVVPDVDGLGAAVVEIGRASCRERGEGWVGGG